MRIIVKNKNLKYSQKRNIQQKTIYCPRNVVIYSPSRPGLTKRSGGRCNPSENSNLRP